VKRTTSGNPAPASLKTVSTWSIALVNWARMSSGCTSLPFFEGYVIRTKSAEHRAV
jgi:hypothetical protein